jgi:hypothetical protein
MTRHGEGSYRYNEHMREHTMVWFGASRRYQNREEIQLEFWSCAQDVCRHSAALMKNRILIASRFILQQFLDMLEGI